MSRLVAAMATMLCAAVVGRSVLRNDHLAYVKSGLTIPLLVAAVLMLLVGAYEWWQAFRGLGAPTLEYVDDGHGHHHKPGRAAPVIGWLLIVPFLVLASVPPTPVGSYTAARSTTNKDASAALGTDGAYAPFAAGDGPVSITVRQFWERASFDTKRSLEGRRVKLVGFASADKTEGGPGWALTRMSIMCCAADAFPVKIMPLGVPERPKDGSWLTVEGIWEPDPKAPAPDSAEAGSTMPRLKVLSVTPTSQPAQPYE
ncbi:hypothetical protein KEM60_00723 [Austwickia sp. TVS 96-490-7B]|uniref:TIGR03943 family putative permease subunit n=1 Tax=Austwickia sp. TVS 96-490-7B TaxID=2830843 RepID=UPI001C5934F4|nr:TIGR03943 family protein [Austwickia sp. TVS 96-490-7B]MBW3084535.1 hypothetical protein [Austwickia sp. TVS 96-490-7B]